MPGQYLVPVLSARASSRTVLQAPVPSPSTGPVLVLVLMARCTFAPKNAAAVVVDVVVVCLVCFVSVPSDKVGGESDWAAGGQRAHISERWK